MLKANAFDRINYDIRVCIFRNFNIYFNHSRAGFYRKRYSSPNTITTMC